MTPFGGGAAISHSTSGTSGTAVRLGAELALPSAAALQEAKPIPRHPRVREVTVHDSGELGGEKSLRPGWGWGKAAASHRPAGSRGRPCDSDAGGILRARQGFCLNTLLRAPKGHHRVTKAGKDLQFT